MEKKSIIELSITAVLIIVLLFAVNNAARKRKNPRHLTSRPASGEIKQDKPAAEPIGEYKDLFNKLKEETKDLKLGRDPFAPSPISSKDFYPSNLHLTGIVWDEENPKAIINDIIAGVGDRISQNRIIEIKKDKVILSDGTSYFEIRLGQ